SGLSAAVLLHALQPLIADGGPLTCSSEEEPTVLQLNQQVASRSLQGVPASLQLLPRQTYLNVDEDAAGTLERKRNFIYCLIVHIMKQEKEMHIDNLVFKVMDSCQKQEAARSPGGGRFGCSTGDVLSCIMHVINKGCVRRNDDNPHIVEFPRPHLSRLPGAPGPRRRARPHAELHALLLPGQNRPEAAGV
uniref:Cullin neddylation domain-containing protein n=1 Tax=Poecilia mexicana TaxID=48701 RepID=A0A3B3XQC8_9TELE